MLKTKRTNPSGTCLLSVNLTFINGFLLTYALR